MAGLVAMGAAENWVEDAALEAEDVAEAAKQETVKGAAKKENGEESEAAARVTGTARGNHRECCRCCCFGFSGDSCWHDGGCKQCSGRNCDVASESCMSGEVGCIGCLQKGGCSDWHGEFAGCGRNFDSGSDCEGNYDCDCGCGSECDCGCDYGHGGVHGEFGHDGCSREKRRRDEYCCDESCCNEGRARCAPPSFVKYSSFGNDFLILTAENTSSSGTKRLGGAQLAELARRHCDRHDGVGADGLLSWRRAGAAPDRFELQIFNADGSEAEMCGNGLRAWSSWWFSNFTRSQICSYSINTNDLENLSLGDFDISRDSGVLNNSNDFSSSDDLSDPNSLNDPSSLQDLHSSSNLSSQGSLSGLDDLKDATAAPTNVGTVDLFGACGASNVSNMSSAPDSPDYDALNTSMVFAAPTAPAVVSAPSLGSAACCQAPSYTQRIEIVTIAGIFPVIARWSYCSRRCMHAPTLSASAISVPKTSACNMPNATCRSIPGHPSSAQSPLPNNELSQLSKKTALVLQEIGVRWAYYPKLQRTYQLPASDSENASPQVVEDWDSGVPHALLWVDQLPGDWLARSSELAHAKIYRQEGKMPSMPIITADQAINHDIKAADQSLAQLNVKAANQSAIQLAAQPVTGPDAHAAIQPVAGTNVDWLVMDRGATSAKIDIYTWERGVGHSLACGTGSIAAAASYFARQSALQPSQSSSLLSSSPSSSSLSPPPLSPPPSSSSSPTELLISYSGRASAIVKIKLHEQMLWLYGPPARPVCQGILL